MIAYHVEIALTNAFLLTIATDYMKSKQLQFFHIPLQYF